MLIEKLKEITNKKSNKDVCQLKEECDQRCIKAAQAGYYSQQFVITYKPELDEITRQFEKWMLDEGLTFMKDDTTNEIKYKITWKIWEKG